MLKSTVVLKMATTNAHDPNSIDLDALDPGILDAENNGYCHGCLDPRRNTADGKCRRCGCADPFWSEVE